MRQPGPSPLSMCLAVRTVPILQGTQWVRSSQPLHGISSGMFFKYHMYCGAREWPHVLPGLVDDGRSGATTTRKPFRPAQWCPLVQIIKRVTVAHLCMAATTWGGVSGGLTAAAALTMSCTKVNHFSPACVAQQRLCDPQICEYMHAQQLHSVGVSP